MNTGPFVYLAGPIAGCTDEECRVWRNHAARLLAPLHTLDPMRRDYRWTSIDHELAARIVRDDKDDIRRSAAVLVYHDRISVGTSMEILYAYEHGVPVFLVNAAGTPALSPWLIYHSREIFTTVEAACDRIAERLGVEELL